MKNFMSIIFLAGFLFTATCYRTSFDANSKNFQKLQPEIPGPGKQASFSRYPRQNRFFSWNENNQFSNNRPNTGGFNWGTGSPSNIIFEDDDFNNFVRPNRPTPTKRPRQSSTDVPIPGMATTRSPCEDRCRATTQFDPVCGDNNVTYTNINWLRCAQKCGRNVNVKYMGSCPRVP